MAGEEGRHRLTDIQTKEVSAVDYAANKRKFIVVKRERGEMVEKKGAEVVPDGKGGLTAAEVQKAQGQLAPATKAVLEEWGARVTKAAAAVVAAIPTAQVAEGEEVPPALLAQVEEALAPPQLAALAKRLPQMTATRLGNLQSAHAALGLLLSEVAKPAESAPETPPPPPAPAPTTLQAEPNVGAESVTKAVAGIAQKLEEAFAKATAEIAKALAAVSQKVDKQGEAITAQAKQVEAVAKARTPSNAGPAQEHPEAVQKAEMLWPRDVNIRRDDRGDDKI